MQKPKYTHQIKAGSGRGCLTPRWGTSTHDPIFDHICAKAGLVRVNFDYGKRPDISRYCWSWVVFVSFLPRLVYLLAAGDIRKLHYRGVNIGHSINEQSIAGSSAGNCDLSVSVLRRARIAIYLTLRLENEIRAGKIGMVLGGDEAYMLFSIAAQFADRNAIPAFFLKGGQSISVEEFDPKFLSAKPRYEEFLIRFLPSVSSGTMAQAKKALEGRIKGDRETLSYMPRSVTDIMHSTPENMPSKAQGRGNEIWLFLHDFYDSPGIYGGNLFPSHYGWVVQTIKHLKKHHAKIFIKRHPNERPANRQIIEALKEKLGIAVTWVEEDVPLKSLKMRGCRAIITVYGSVIVEAAYIGIPVIAAGRSPYVSFDICYRANSLSEYYVLLSEAITAGGLPPKSQSSAVLAESVVRIVEPRNRRSVAIPFDDLGNVEWDLCALGDYPLHNYQRREMFLRSSNVREFVLNKLQAHDLIKELGLSNVLRSGGAELDRQNASTE